MEFVTVVADDVDVVEDELAIVVLDDILLCREIAEVEFRKLVELRRLVDVEVEFVVWSIHAKLYARNTLNESRL